MIFFDDECIRAQANRLAPEREFNQSLKRYHDNSQLLVLYSPSILLCCTLKLQTNFLHREIHDASIFFPAKAIVRR